MRDTTLLDADGTGCVHRARTCDAPSRRRAYARRDLGMGKHRPDRPRSVAAGVRADRGSDRARVNRARGPQARPLRRWGCSLNRFSRRGKRVGRALCLSGGRSSRAPISPGYFDGPNRQCRRQEATRWRPRPEWRRTFDVGPRSPADCPQVSVFRRGRAGARLRCRHVGLPCHPADARRGTRDGAA